MPGIGSQACPKPKTRYTVKAEKQTAKTAQQRIVYQLVTMRDSHACRVCGRFLNPRALGLLDRAHHHHVVYRSRGGKDESQNLILLCARCHDEEHAGKLRLSGDADLRDADGKLCGIKVERPTPEGWQVIAWT